MGLEQEPSGPRRAVQRKCDDVPSQNWDVLPDVRDQVQVRNQHDATCLTLANDAVRTGTRIVLEPRQGARNQLMTVIRDGNTFRLRGAHSERCLEVPDDSRNDDVAIEQAACTGAAIQQWTIDARRQDDFERLYQAEKNAFTWATSASGQYPLPVTIGALRICRSNDAQQWLGGWWTKPPASASGRRIFDRTSGRAHSKLSSRPHDALSCGRGCRGRHVDAVRPSAARFKKDGSVRCFCQRNLAPL